MTNRNLLTRLWLWSVVTWCVFELPSATNGAVCDRMPPGMTVPKTRADNRFSIEISGDPQTYSPGEMYTVKLVGGGRGTPGVAKFTWFSLSVEAGSRDGSPPGRLFLFGDSGTMYADSCPNTIAASSLAAKTEVTALWSAPARGAGCVIFRATVQEHSDVWYQDDGPLSKTLCEDLQQNSEEQPQINDPCCACDEAKYEVSFEGLWSRHTHPKDFPESSSTRFSDVIGASHTTDYRFWEYGGRASEGLKQVAELGSTRRLETELKLKSQHIRTIIKARGISYPNVTSKTFAVFRVDNKHHLISLVSMIDPSPDWIVGVSGLELCLSNCSWLETKTLNLYPWDAGTDSGVTYTSPDIPTEPQDHIRRITNSFPADPRSPFYDPTGEEMKPLARLVLSRQRLYEKSCAESSADTPSNDVGDACEVDQWSSWSECSVTCGLGKRSRQRNYKDNARANTANCNKELTSRKQCYGSVPCKDPTDPDDPIEPPSDSMCAMSQWSDWSGCSVACGVGVKTRFRTLVHPKNWKKCKALSSHMVTQQDDECIGEQGKDCPEEEPGTAQLIQGFPEGCEMSSWSDWSACSATCGVGTRERSRSPVGPNRYRPECNRGMKETMPCSEQYSCQLTPEEAREVCRLPKLVGPCRTSHVEKFYFDASTAACKSFTYSGCRGNRNQFDTLQECEAACKEVSGELIGSALPYYEPGNPMFSGLSSGSHKVGHFAKPPPVFITSAPSGRVQDCKVSDWTAWSECSVSCGKGTKTKERQIEMVPGRRCIAWMNTGNSCSFSDRSAPRVVQVNHHARPAIKVYSRNGGEPCPKRLMRRKTCYKKPNCPVPGLHTEEDKEDSGPEYPYSASYDELQAAGCVYTEWSAWSLCSATCGLNSVQQRARSIDRKNMDKRVDPKNCLARLETRVCNVFPCRKSTDE